MNLITRRSALAAGAGALAAIAAGCSSGGGDASATAPADTGEGFPRTIRHALGATTIPRRPERVVSLDTAGITDPLLALGITPVGATTYTGTPGGNRFPPAIEPLTEGVRSVGGNGEPNFEAIAALEPDLIVGYEFSFGEEPSKVTGIAPSVAVDVGGVYGWDHELLRIAEATGREDAVAGLVEEVGASAERARGRVGRSRVAVIRPQTESFIHDGPNSQSGRFVAMANVSTEGFLPGEPFGDVGTRVSLERLGDLSGDHLFVLTYDIDPDEFESLYERNRLWRQLPAVRAGNVHPVEGTAWTDGGVLALQSVLEEAADALAGAG